MMKILQALVGYLAVIASDLPYPFAFASPLEIHYDGYVNSTAMQNTQVVETCQMDTTHGKNHEARQLEYLPEVAIIVSLVSTVTLSILWIKQDNPKREAFTQNTITQVLSTYPHFNWVVCHSPYSIQNFDGAFGTDYGYTHHELPISFDRTIGYDLFWAKSGSFTRYGDGGFINWAYNGNILGTDNDGATVHFGTLS